MEIDRDELERIVRKLKSAHRDLECERPKIERACDNASASRKLREIEDDFDRAIKALGRLMNA